MSHRSLIAKPGMRKSASIAMLTFPIMNKASYTFVLLIIISTFFSPVMADLFVGSFNAEVDGKSYRLIIEPPVNKRYDGIFMITDTAMQVDARRFGDLFVGRLTGKNKSFGFRAEILGDAPLVSTETGLVIKFRRDRQ